MSIDNSSFENLMKSEEGKLDTDLGGMDKEAAHEYVLAFATTLKETQRARGECENEKSLWEQRVVLAKSKNEEALAVQAQAKADELGAKLVSLRQEEAELKRKVSFMKDELKRLRGKPELTLDPEALLAQLEMAAGQPDTTLKKIKSEQAALDLEELKKKMQGEGK